MSNYNSRNNRRQSGRSGLTIPKPKKTKNSTNSAGPGYNYNPSKSKPKSTGKSKANNNGTGYGYGNYNSRNNRRRSGPKTKKTKTSTNSAGPGDNYNSSKSKPKSTGKSKGKGKSKAQNNGADNDNDNDNVNGYGKGKAKAKATATGKATECKQSCKNTYFKFKDPRLCPPYEGKGSQQTLSPAKEKEGWECEINMEQLGRQSDDTSIRKYNNNFNIYKQTDDGVWVKNDAGIYKDYIEKFSKNKLCQLLRQRSMKQELVNLPKDKSWTAWKKSHNFQVSKAKDRANNCQKQLISLGRQPVERTLASKTEIANDMAKGLQKLADSKHITLGGKGKVINTAIFDESLKNCSDDCLGDGSRLTTSDYDESIDTSNTNVRNNNTYNNKKTILMEMPEVSPAWNLTKRNNRRNGPYWSKKKQQWAKNALKSWPKPK
jgi:hypothetical protein